LSIFQKSIQRLTQREVHPLVEKSFQQSLLLVPSFGLSPQNLCQLMTPKLDTVVGNGDEA
jgi:hypothetical protein